VVLTPGIFCKALHAIHIEENMTNNSKCTKLYPIELYIGGTNGNNGLKNSDFVLSNKSGIVTLFFEHQDIQRKWSRLFEKATGSYSIRNYYTSQKPNKEEIEDKQH